MKKKKLLIEGPVFYKNKKNPNLDNSTEVFNSIKTSNLVLINDYNGNMNTESSNHNMILIKDYSEKKHYSKNYCCCS